VARLAPGGQAVVAVDLEHWFTAYRLPGFKPLSAIDTRITTKKTGTAFTGFQKFAVRSDGVAVAGGSWGGSTGSVGGVLGAGIAVLDRKIAMLDGLMFNNPAPRSINGAYIFVVDLSKPGVLNPAKPK